MPGQALRRLKYIKRTCKTRLQRELALEADGERPLIAFASRLAHQKMADVMADRVPAIVEAGAQFALVGEGEPGLEATFHGLAAPYRGSVAAGTGCDEALAHRLHAGADIPVARAWFEPCGLTQMYAARYGTLPVVRNTGGLADTVTDATPETLASRTATGFVFEEPILPALAGAVDGALALHRQPLSWRRLQRQAMSQDFSWDKSAAKYVELYRQTLGVRDLPQPEPLPHHAAEAMLGRLAAT